MKTRLSRLLLIGQVSLLLFYLGCDKKSSTGPNDTPSAAGSGSDYFPLTGNQTLIGKATGQSVTYDSLGNVVQSQAVSQQEVKGFIGPAIVVGGMQSYPLYSFNNNGTTTTFAKSYIAQSNQSIVGFAAGTANVQFITALPAEIKVGTTWIANPSDVPGKQVTLQVVDSKSSYTNSAGKTYSNVIKVNTAFTDSISTTTSDSTSSFTLIQKTKVNVDIYFAKTIGLVDVQINQFESIYKYSGSYSFGVRYYFSYYSRTTVSGTIGRTN
jgi:hypothetical protein